MKTDNIIKSIVDAVKSKDELACVTCVYSHSRDIAENPVCSFTLCIGLGKAKYAKNPDSSSPDFTTEVKLCLLAPSGAGGKRLSEVSLWIAEAIRENLSISSLEVSEPEYNETSSTLFADIKVTVEDVSLADTVCHLYIDGVKTEGVVSFEIESAELTEKHPQLLNGYTPSKTGAEEFFIKLKTQSFLKLSDEAELRFGFGAYDEVYSGCSISKIKRELSRWGNLCFTFDITAKSCELVVKEVQND